MTALSSDSTGALEYLSVFTDSGYYGLSNVQVRAICAALRAPALPSGEVEGIGPTDCAEHMLLQARAKGYEGWTNIYAAQLAHFATYCDVRATSLQPRPTTPPFSRWADIIESASLTIGPNGSEALNALAAEVRAGGVSQRPIDREQLAALLYVTRWPHRTWITAGLDETAHAYRQADAVLSLVSSTEGK